jgi:Fe2+ or Zn2+ uptake regulation protein
MAAEMSSALDPRPTRIGDPICITCDLAADEVNVPHVNTPEELAIAFRASGRRVTPQRQLLFGLLSGNLRHPSAEALFAVAAQAMPGISLRTVYQTLTDLVTMGEVQVLDLGTGAARFDPNVGDHHHVVCDRCGDVRDVYVPGVSALALDGDGELDGFAVDRTQVVFRGTCQTCLAHSSSHPNPINE